MTSRLRRGVGATLAAILVIATILAWCSPRPEATAIEDRPVRTAPEARGPAGAPPAHQTPSQSDAVTPPKRDCESERQELAEIVAAVADDCRAELLAGDCRPPIPHLGIYFPPEQQVALVDERLASCPNLSMDDAALDCSEFPCLILFRREALARPDACDLLKETARRAEEISPPRPGIEQEWAIMSVTFPRGDIAPAHLVGAKLRERSRLALLQQRLLHRSTETLRIDSGERWTCEEIAGKVERARSDDSCNVVRAEWGCPEEPVDARQRAAIEQHVAAAHAMAEALAADCPEFAARAWTVDCSELPCLLAFESTNPVRPETLCADPLLDDLDVVTASLHPDDWCDQTAIIPLWNAGDLITTMPEAAERYEGDERTWRLGRACEAVQALRTE